MHDRVARLLQSFDTQTRLPPPASAQALHVGHAPCGWAAAAVQPTLRQLPDVTDHGSHLSLPADDAALARVAQALRAQGHLGYWRDERLDVVDADGLCHGSIERAAMRPLGFATQSVHLNAYTPDGSLWIARRADTKTVDPGLWDTLVGGLIATGESPALALLRESAEEAGLAPDDLQQTVLAGRFTVSRHLPEGYQVEHVAVTDCVLPAGCTPCNQDGEVAEIRTAALPEVLAMIANGVFTTEAALCVLYSLARRHAAPTATR